MRQDLLAGVDKYRDFVYDPHWRCSLLTFEDQQRAFVRQRLHDELSDLGVDDADGLRQQLRAVLTDPGDAAVRTRFRDLVQRFAEIFMIAIAELDDTEPLDWWRAATWALEQCGFEVLPSGCIAEVASAERRSALRRHLAMAARHPAGGACYAVTNMFSGSDPDDPSYGPLVIDGWLKGESPTISICIGTECTPAEPVHVLDAFLAPMRVFETSTNPRAVAAAQFLEQVIDGAIRQLELQFAEEFLVTWTSERRDAGQLPS